MFQMRARTVGVGVYRRSRYSEFMEMYYLIKVDALIHRRLDLQ